MKANPVIDMHRHLWSVMERYFQRPEPPVRDPSGTIAAGAEASTMSVQQRGIELIEEMDASGVDCSVIFMADYGLAMGEGRVSVEDENRLYAEMARAYGDRMIPFVGVDPRRPNALELFRAGLDRWGIRGLKLHPCTGFYPHDPVCLPFYELAGERGAPVLIHTGPFAAPLYSQYAKPIHIDAIAADFPKTTFIMAHSGLCWWPEALEIAYFKKNVILELSFWQVIYLRDPKEFVSAIAKMRDSIGVERIVFGSDFPGFRYATSLGEWVDVFRRLPDLAGKHGYRITDEEVRAILGGNARRILGIASEGA